VNSLIRAGVVILPALALGYAALGSGLDRMSEASPALATIVPQGFRAAAWRGGARIDLARGQLRAAADKSLRAILADPMDAGSSSGLGLARLKLKDGIAAEAAFRVAGQLGWRDQPTQLYWMALSANSGAFALAAQRADALLRQDSSLREQPAVLAQLETSPAGRTALAERLALHPAWANDYWNKLYLLNVGQLANRVLVLDEAALRPPVLSCADVQTLIGAIEAQEPARGRSIKARYCSSGVSQLLVDGGFEAAQLANVSGPGWQFAGAGGLDVRITTGARNVGKAVTVASTLPLRQVFASQALELPPGRYLVAWHLSGGAGGSTSGIQVRLTCTHDGGDYLVPMSAGAGRSAAAAAIAPGCRQQWLDLAIDPGVGPITVDDVTVDREG
jgi:hypothetical protein